MLERADPVLKAISLTLAMLLVFQLGRLVVRSNPLAHLKIPDLPSLPPETNSPASASAATTTRLDSKATSAATNVASGVSAGKVVTNAPQPNLAKADTNSPTAVPGKTGTDSGAEHRAGIKETNALARSQSASTNLSPSPVPGSSNQSPKAVAGPPPGIAGMGPFGPQGVPKAPELPLPILARVDRITDSEILGPVIRPLPAGLLGIAGDAAFLRAASGQSGVVKEGDSLGALKLLRIGINRVLVEDDGQQKELMIFSGYGGESLLPKPKEQSK